MALICVDGPALIYVGPQDCAATGVPALTAVNNFYELGITESGVQISVGGQVHRVMSDDMGGSEGMPAELLYMGATASIRGVLVKYNGDNINMLISGVNKAGDEGSIALPGTPVFAAGYGFSIAIQGRQKVFYFPKCELISNPREFNISSTERKTSFTATAYPVYIGDSCAGSIYYTADVTSSVCPGCSCGYGGEVSPAQACANVQ